MVQDEEEISQIPLTVRNTSYEMGATIIIQLLVKARALNSKSSVGVTYLLEPQVWDSSRIYVMCISPGGMYLPLAYLSITFPCHLFCLLATDR